MSSRYAVAMLLAIVAVTTAAQTPHAPSETSSRTSSTDQCASLATKNANFLPLVRACEYAASLRRSLPDFVCVQTAESSGYPRNLSPIVVHAQVTYQGGRNQYTDVVVNGTPAYGEKFDIIDFMRLIATNEFGGELIDLFEWPFVTDFKFLTDEMVGPVRAAVYGFKVPAAKNRFWAIGDKKATLNSGYGGELYVNWETGRPLRIVVRLTDLPKSFQIVSAVNETNYSDVDIAELGVFLLPAYSESNVCLRQPRTRSHSRGAAESDNCFRGVVWFHDCHKFAVKSRVVELTSPP